MEIDLYFNEEEGVDIDNDLLIVASELVNILEQASRKCLKFL